MDRVFALACTDGGSSCRRKCPWCKDMDSEGNSLVGSMAKPRGRSSARFGGARLRHPWVTYMHTDHGGLLLEWMV